MARSDRVNLVAVHTPWTNTTPSKFDVGFTFLVCSSAHLDALVCPTAPEKMHSYRPGSQVLATRQAFLNLCKTHEYQFDDLRRARHSSMMVSIVVAAKMSCWRVDGEGNSRGSTMTARADAVRLAIVVRRDALVAPKHWRQSTLAAVPSPWLVLVLACVLLLGRCCSTCTPRACRHLPRLALYASKTSLRGKICTAELALPWTSAR